MAKPSGAAPRAPSIAQLIEQLHALLTPLSTDERAKVVRATFVLFDEAIPIAIQAAGNDKAKSVGQTSNTETGTAAQYFATKDPRNKAEELAVAARYRELTDQGDIHTREQLRSTVTNARINFDNRNFPRDIRNAKSQSKYFNLGTDRDQHTLSYYGQQYIDTLPDRKAASKIKKPKGGGGRKKDSSKKKSQ